LATKAKQTERLKHLSPGRDEQTHALPDNNSTMPTTSARAPWKNRICSATTKLRKSLVKPVTRQKTCNYIELFGSSARDRYAQRI